MSKFNYVFFGGVPRACSTISVNILAQNPIFTISPTSGLVEIAYRIYKDEINHFIQPNKNPLEIAKLSVDNLLTDFVKTPYYIDKSRNWIQRHALHTNMFNNCKFIVGVRDVRGIYCSVENLSGNFNSWERDVQNLTKVFKKKGKPDNVYVYKAEEFSINPEKVINEIYKFLDINLYNHTFNDLQELIPDSSWKATGIEELHKIHSSIKKLDTSYDNLISKQKSNSLLEKYYDYQKIFYPETI